MNISRSAGYGMMAVGYIAKQDGNAFVLASTVSKKYSIPNEYLLKILQQLVRANILRSKRGPRGGFSMARPSTEISMREIIEAISGPLSGHLGIIDQANGDPFSHTMEEDCRQASAKCTETLENTKLSQMIK